MDFEQLPGTGIVKRDQYTGAATSLGRHSRVSLSGVETGNFFANAKFGYLNKVKRLKINSHNWNYYVLIPRERDEHQ